MTLFTKNEIVPITAANGAVGVPINVGSEPDAIAIDAAGTEAVVANHGSGTASLVDLTKRQVTGTVTVGLHPDAVVITPSGTALVANYGSASVTPIDLSTGTAGRPVGVPAGPDALVLSPTGARSSSPAS